jgi:colanic acid/amylovoran biosynthesis protein
MNTVCPEPPPRGPPVFLISGGSLSGNKGAVAMTLAAIGRLRALAPGCRLRLLSRYPTDDQALAAAEGIDLVPAPPPRMVTTMAIRALASLALRLPPTGPLSDSILRAYREADVLLDISGDTLSDNYTWRSVMLNVSRQLAALAAGIPVVKLSQAIGPFRTWCVRRVARFLLEHCSLVIARGETTAREVRALLGSRTACHVCADLAFLLEPASAEAVDAALRACGAPLHGYVGVSLSSTTEHHARLRRKRSDYRTVMRDLVSHILQATDRPVVLVPHAAREGRIPSADWDVSRDVLERLPQRKGVFLIGNDLDPRVLKGVIGRSEVCVVCRFHAMVAALGSAVPPMVIGWSPKYREVMDAFGVGSSCYDFADSSASRLAAAFSDLWAGRAALRERIRSHLADVRYSAEENFRLLRQFLREEGLV